MCPPPQHLNYDQLYEGWEIINALSKNTLNSNLNELLDQTFSHMAKLDWLNIEERGAILLKTSGDELVLSAQHGYSKKQATYCERVTLDRCGFDQVFQTKTVGFTACEAQDISEYKWNHFILPLIDNDKVFGLITLFSQPGRQPNATEHAMLQKLADALSIIVSRIKTDEILFVRHLEVEESKKETIHHLGIAAEYRDHETGMHVLRMSHYAGAIAKKTNLSEHKREILTIAAPMHDVGKIGISDNILLKPGPLTSDEYDIMKTHSLIGCQILEGNDELMQAARKIALSHHEKWDGTGYPNGLKGEDISIYGRICCLADIFDALTSKRPYKKAWSVEKAVETIKKDSGKTFDPDLVEAFIEVLPEILRIKTLFRDEIIDPEEKLKLQPTPKSKDDWVSWDDTYGVGIDSIDEHHQYLFSLTNNLHDAISRQRGTRKIAQTLNALKQYTIIHFREEERMMQHYNFSRLDLQISQHQYFTEKLDDFWELFKQNPLILGFEMIHYLRDWLVNHIQKEDKQLAGIITSGKTV